MSFVWIRRLNDIKNAPDHRHQAWLQRFNYRHSGPQGGPNNKQTSGEHLETKSFKWCRVAEFLRKNREKSMMLDDVWSCILCGYEIGKRAIIHPTCVISGPSQLNGLPGEHLRITHSYQLLGILIPPYAHAWNNIMKLSLGHARNTSLEWQQLSQFFNFKTSLFK